MPPVFTPDGRYLVVRGRLWRTRNPALSDAVAAYWVGQLMDARRAVKLALPKNGLARNPADLASARAAVQTAKVALGERGPVWWTDGTPDFNRCLAKNTPYAAWFAGLGDTKKEPAKAP